MIEVHLDADGSYLAFLQPTCRPMITTRASSPAAAVAIAVDEDHRAHGRAMPKLDADPSELDTENG